MAKIGIDCDGVLANFTKAYGTIGNRIVGETRYKEGWEPPDWDFGGLFTKDEDKKIWAAIRGTHNFWLGLDAYSNDLGSLAQWLLAKAGHEVHIVTSRAETAGMPIAWQTQKWLDACGVKATHNYLGVIPVSDSNEKWKVYQSVGIEYSIDDKLETVQQCDLIHPGVYTHKAFLLDKPWNQHGTVQNRIKSVEAYLKEIA